MKYRNDVIVSVLALGIVLMFAFGATFVGDSGIVDEEYMGTVDNAGSYSTGTNVEWHGTLDLYIKPAGSNEWERVVFSEPNLITNLGANRLRGYLNGSDPGTTTIANLSLSNDAGVASAAWTELPVEIAANGLDRATAVGGVVNNGTGAFNITHTWTASASQSAQLIGTHWNSTDELDGNLFSALKFTQQNLLVNDQLKAVYSVTIS